MSKRGKDHNPNSPIEKCKPAMKYLDRVEAELTSMRTAAAFECEGGYRRRIAVINFQKNGKVIAPVEYEPTKAERKAIKKDFKKIEWPELNKVQELINTPKYLKEADAEDIFTFRDEKELIVMLQQRIDNSKGGKAYIPWTYWDDDEWRRMEPEGKLPLWGLGQLNDHSVVFVHEGAKAARRMQRMVKAETQEWKRVLKDHPWGKELSHAAHIGWIGGALSPSRTDWSALKRLGVKVVYIVSDNDTPGVAAVAKISFQLRLKAYHLQFTSEWPASFDLADDFPVSMFSEIDGKQFYTGPSMRACIHPATWATDQISNDKGKPITVLRDGFKSQWAYVEEVDLFVCIDMPEIVRTEMIMNKMLSAFSHVNNTSQLIVRNYQGRKVRICYRPDNKGRIVTDKTTTAINLHTPTTIIGMEGDPTPWLDFMEYMFPIKQERDEMLKWCATLIAKPEIRMEFGVLLVSEKQGIGKTTLGAKILAPLVGHHNTGFPSEREITDSNFNSWLVNKRLVVVNEIYSGHSWKAYNTLKSYITDKDIQVNEKYIRPYNIENWVHIFASSNSRKALKMEDDDRRWFYPQVSEIAWSRVNFTKFNDWLNSGGLSIIKCWAENYRHYFHVGTPAPMTERKRELIDNSRSDAQQELADFLEALVEEKMEVALAMKEVVIWLKTKVQKPIFDSDHDLKKVAIAKGFMVFPKRVRYRRQLQYVIVSPIWVENNRSAFESAPDSLIDMLKQMIKHPDQIVDRDM